MAGERRSEKVREGQRRARGRVWKAVEGGRSHLLGAVEDAPHAATEGQLQHGERRAALALSAPTLSAGPAACSRAVAAIAAEARHVTRRTIQEARCSTRLWCPPGACGVACAAGGRPRAQRTRPWALDLHRHELVHTCTARTHARQRQRAGTHAACMRLASVRHARRSVFTRGKCRGAWECIRVNVWRVQVRWRALTHCIFPAVAQRAQLQVEGDKLARLAGRVAVARARALVGLTEAREVTAAQLDVEHLALRNLVERALLRGRERRAERRSETVGGSRRRSERRSEKVRYGRRMPEKVREAHGRAEIAPAAARAA